MVKKWHETRYLVSVYVDKNSSTKLETILELLKNTKGVNDALLEDEMDVIDGEWQT